MPYIRRLPKRGFNNAQFKTIFAIVNLADLNDFEDGTVINEATLREKGLIRGRFDGIKILGNGELTRKLTFSVCKISASAAEKIQKAGGSLQSPSEAVASDDSTSNN